MPQWEHWLRDFLQNWLDALADSMSSLERERRKQFEEALGEFDSTEIEGFGEAWSKLEDPKPVKERVRSVLSTIEEPSQKQKASLKDWFSILMDTVEKQNEDARARLLSVCGETCASHATDAFKKSWSESEGLDEFLEKVNTRVCDGQEFFRFVDEHIIEVEYPRCLCPLVGFGLICSPNLCNCSSAWLKTNFEEALGKTVIVDRIDTVLNGHSSCNFRVKV